MRLPRGVAQHVPHEEAAEQAHRQREGADIRGQLLAEEGLALGRVSSRAVTASRRPRTDRVAALAARRLRTQFISP
jgi:hypothetical protein